MKKTIAGLATLAIALASASAAEARQIGKASARGDYAIAVASGNASNPDWVKVTVTTSPAQSATGNWFLVCSKGLGAGSKSGNFDGSGRFTRTMRMPTRNPDDCTASASAQLDDGGKITVTLTAG